jgi:hypothetical protein
MDMLRSIISWSLWLPQVLDSNVWVRLPDWVGILGMFAPVRTFCRRLLAYMTARRDWGSQETAEARLEP